MPQPIKIGRTLSDHQRDSTQEIDGKQSLDKDATTMDLGEDGRIQSEHQQGVAQDDGHQPQAASGANVPFSNNVLYSHSADDLKDFQVVDKDDKDIGEIDHMVLSNDKLDAFAVVSVGGLLGVGARDVMVPVSDMTLQADETIKISTDATEVAGLNDYVAETYTEVEGNTPLSDAMRH